MQVPAYSDGRPVNYDETSERFKVRDTPVIRGPAGTRKSASAVGLVAVGLLAVSGLLALFATGCGSRSAVTPSSQGESASQTAPSASGGSSSQPTIGQPFKTGKLEITVTGVDMKDSVGGGSAPTKPSDVQTFVAVRWKYTNITKDPIGMFSKPSIKLVDAGGKTLEPDVGASAAYVAELKLPEKPLGDISPGTTVTGAEVFEVYKDSFDPNTWAVLIKGDKQVKVPLR